MLRNYETTFIVDAHLPGDQIEAAIEKYTQFIEKHEGKMVSIDRWGKRRLAYEINKKQYGYYVCIRFDAQGDFIKEFEREFKLDEQILRYLTTVIPHIVRKEEARLERLKAREAAAQEEADQDAGTPAPKAEPAAEKPAEAPAEEAAPAEETKEEEAAE